MVTSSHRRIRTFAAFTTAALLFALATACSSGSSGSSGSRPSSSSSTVAAKPVNGLVDIGGRSLYANCTGQKRPTVVLEAGMEEGHEDWDLVRKQLGDLRVCAYDRAGVGNSDAATKRPRTATDVVADLHALLGALHEPPPYLLVGFSFGGIYTQLFADLHPQEVAGMVLVDTVHPDEARVFDPHLTADQIAADRADLESNWEGIDPFASMDEVHNAGSLPRVPIIVLTAGRSDGWPPGWNPALFDRLRARLQRQLGTGPERTQLIAKNSGHDIPHEDPGLVAQAIKTALRESNS